MAHSKFKFLISFKKSMKLEKPFVHACTVEPILNPFILKKININKYAPTYYKIYLLKMISLFATALQLLK